MIQSIIKGTDIPSERSRCFAFIVDEFELENQKDEEGKKAPIKKIYYENVKEVGVVKYDFEKMAGQSYDYALFV